MESGESKERVSTSGGLLNDFSHSHHHDSSLKHHQNGLGSAVLCSLTNVLELLKCSVCFDFMYSPIYQYHNGHTLCSSCKARVLNKCPSFRQQLGNIRCLALEKMTESLELPCKYEESGCPEIIPYYTKLLHEKSCNFRPYSCPWSGCPCSAVGDFPVLVSHLTDHHNAYMFYSCKFKREFLIEDLYKHQSYTWAITIINCFGKYFCLHAEAFLIGSTPVYMAFISLIGNQADTCNYRYSLEIGGNGRKINFEGIPRSIRESGRRTMASADSLIVLGSMVYSLGGETRGPILEVRGRIWNDRASPSPLPISANSTASRAASKFPPPCSSSTEQPQQSQQQPPDSLEGCFAFSNSNILPVFSPCK